MFRARAVMLTRWWREHEPNWPILAAGVFLFKTILEERVNAEDWSLSTIHFNPLPTSDKLVPNFPCSLTSITQYEEPDFS